MVDSPILNENNGRFKINVKEFIAITLIILGVTIGIWVFLNASAMYIHPESISSFQHLIQNNIDATITIKEKETVKIIVAPELISYIIPILLLMLCISISGIFIAGGVKLLSSEIKYLKENIYKVFEKMKSNLGINKDS